MYRMAQREQQLNDLLRDFSEFATKVARVLVWEVEHEVPVKDRRIPPSQAFGGQAGGEKYVHAGILFKVCVLCCFVHSSLKV